MIRSTAIILLNWNGWRDTIPCLESLLRLRDDAIGIFVCDNESSDDSVARLRAWAFERLPDASRLREDMGLGPFIFDEYTADPGRNPRPNWPPATGTVGRICLVNTGGNFGFAGGSNVGLRFALADGYERFWLLNNDTEVAPDTLRHLLDRMDQDPTIGMCGSTLVYAANPEVVQNLGGGRISPYKGKGVALGAGQSVKAPIDREGIEKAMTFVSGASMLVSRSFLEQIGLMAEDYFLYFEEPDWAERGKGRFTLGYAPASIVKHKVGASSGTSDFEEQSEFATFYQNRNRIRFCRRFHRKALPFVYADLCREVVRAGLQRRWRKGLTLIRAMTG